MTNAGGSITLKRVQEIQYPERSEDVGTDGLNFEDVNGMTGTASPEEDVTEGDGGDSLLEMQRDEASVQMFRGARGVRMTDTEIVNAGENVIIEWFVVDLALFAVLAHKLLRRSHYCHFCSATHWGRNE